MTGYDFDKTIYDGDCFIDFYLFSVFHRPYILLMLPLQLILLIFTFFNKKLIKQFFACYLVIIFKKNDLIYKFWDKNLKKIKRWYIKQKTENDIIISASPTFLIKEACKRLGIKNYIATDMNLKNGNIKGKNCYGKEKLLRFKSLFPSITLDAFYSDSKSDFVLKDVSKKIYLVKKDRIIEILKK